jgi:TolB protein
MKTKISAVLLLSVFLLVCCSISNASDPSLECVSGKVVFTKYQDTNNQDANNLYVLDLKTKEESVIYSDPTATGLGSPSWSPDGRSISFPRYSGDNSDIYILSLKDLKTRRITNTPNIELSPSWSPDGNVILTDSDVNGYGQLFKVKVDGSSAEQITNGNYHFYHAS